MNNTKNNKLLPALTILLLVVNVITLVMLWMNSRRPVAAGPVPPPVFEFVSRELGLSETQQQQYKELRVQHQAQQRAILDSIARAKDDFFSLLKQKDAGDSMVAAFNQRALQLQGRLELINFQHFRQLRAICNSDQQEKFDHIIAEVLHRLAGPARPRGGHPPMQGNGDATPPGPPETGPGAPPAP